MAIIDEYLPAIRASCRQHGVLRLELFGSAASGEFDPKCSDFDFFYEFDQSDPRSIADRFFDLHDDLQAMLGRDVDLVSEKDVKNPFFLQVANRHRTVVYDAAIAQICS